MKLLILLLCACLAGCAQLGAKVTLSDGTVMSERAYIGQKQFEAEKACYESRAFVLPDNPTSEQVLAFAIAELAKQNAKPCAGTNANDVAIAKTKARWAFASAFARVAAGAYSIGEIADTVSTIAKTRVSNNTTYNTSVGSISQSNSTSITASTGGGDSEGMSGAGGSGGDVTTNENGDRSNQIVLNGDGALAGERAAAGDTALVNGDSSLQSFVVDSELKESPLADEQNDLDQSDGEGFNDADASNNGLLEL